jgi:hypothetical protein
MPLAKIALQLIQEQRNRREKGKGHQEVEHSSIGDSKGDLA